MRSTITYKEQSRMFLHVRLKDIKLLRTLKTLIEVSMRAVLIVAVLVTAITVVTSNTEAFFGIKSFTVLSGSMEPTLPVGSIIYTQKNLGYNLGDIITFKTSSGMTVTHRVVRVENTGEVIYKTKGDANSSVDSSVVTADKIIGKTYFFLPYIGKISATLKTPQGLIVSVFLPALVVILYELWIIKKEIEKGVEQRLLEKLRQQGEVSTQSLWLESTS